MELISCLIRLKSAFLLLTILGIGEVGAKVDLDGLARSRGTSYISEFRQRQEDVREFVIENVDANLANAFLTESTNNNFTFESVIQPVLDILEEEMDADFYIIQLLRLMYTTDKYNDKIIPYLENIPLWVNQADILRVYWSENHMIMYCSSRFLLEQLLGEDSFYPPDETLREKLIWWLKAKIEVGFYEFYSHYLRYTLTALLNLYDYSEDLEIKDLAHEALNTLFKEMFLCFNSDGFCMAATGRGVIHHHGQESYMNSTAEHVIAHMSLGTDLDIENLNQNVAFHISTLAFASSSFIPSAALEALQTRSNAARKIGHTFAEGEVLRQNLTSQNDKFVAGMTLGGYGHPDYVSSTLSFVTNMDIWGHATVKSYSFAKHIPSSLWRPMALFAGTFTEGSIMEADFRMWKHDGATMSSIQNYFPGKKGYQQIPWMAGTGDIATLTMSAESSNVTSTRSINNYFMNNQLPYIEQNENLALIMYNPSGDLSYLYKDSLEVMLLFEKDRYDSVEEVGNWIFGERRGSFVGVFRHCISENFTRSNDLFVCEDDQQIWVSIVGNEQIHGSFDNFIKIVAEDGEVDARTGQKCIFGSASIDGKQLKHVFCQDFGNFNRALIVVSCALFVFVASCYAVKRKVKKIVVARRLSKASSVDAGVPPEYANDFEEEIKQEKEEPAKDEDKNENVLRIV